MKRSPSALLNVDAHSGAKRRLPLVSEKTVEEIAQAVCDYATVVEGASFDLKRRIGAVFGAGIKEETFSSLLGWVEAKGDKLGVYQHTSREANSNSDAYARGLSILKVNNADIKTSSTRKAGPTVTGSTKTGFFGV